MSRAYSLGPHGMAGGLVALPIFPFRWKESGNGKNERVNRQACAMTGFSLSLKCFDLSELNRNERMTGSCVIFTNFCNYYAIIIRDVKHVGYAFTVAE